MNTSFNFNRFLQVLSNEWCLNLKKILFFWGGILVISILYFSFFAVLVKDVVPKDVTFGWAFFVMFIMQGFYLQNYFYEFSSKKRTQALLLLPASRNETFWAKFLLSVVLYFVIFFAYIFILLKWNEIQNSWIMETRDFHPDKWRHRSFESYQTFTITLWVGLWYFFLWLFSASAYLLGCMSFKKLAALKSIVCCFAIIIALQMITYIIYFLFTGVWPLWAFPGVGITLNRSGTLNNITDMFPILQYGFFIFICLALILISRVKYNEKTI